MREGERDRERERERAPEEGTHYHEKMCFQKKCGTCGKTTWGGCGKHVPGVYQRIPEGQVCMCKDWPGVVFPKEVAKEGKPEGQSEGKPEGKQSSAPAAVLRPSSK